MDFFFTSLSLFCVCFGGGGGVYLFWSRSCGSSPEECCWGADDVPLPRHKSAMAVIGSSLYIFGGTDVFANKTNDLWQITPGAATSPGDPWVSFIGSSSRAVYAVSY